MGRNGIFKFQGKEKMNKDTYKNLQEIAILLYWFLFLGLLGLVLMLQ